MEIFYDYSIRDAFEYFIENLSFISSEINNVVIRPHPSETNQKWAWAQKNKLVKKINNKESLIEQILNSDLIVGCETMAMIVGVRKKKGYKYNSSGWKNVVYHTEKLSIFK